MKNETTKEQESLTQESAQWKQHFAAKDNAPKAANAPEKEQKAENNVEEKPKIEEKVEEIQAEPEISETPTPVEQTGSEETPKEDFPTPKALETKEKIENREKATWQRIKNAQAALSKAQADFEKSKNDFMSQTREQVRQEFMAKRPDIVLLEPNHYFQQAETYEKQADLLDQQGETAQAAQLRKEAINLHKQGVTLEGQLKGWKEEEGKRENQKKEYEARVNSHKQEQLKQLNAENPDLLNPESPLRKQIDSLYSDPQIVQLLKSTPNEYWFAVKIGNALAKAEAFTALEVEHKKLKEELLKVNKKLTPSVGSDTGVPKTKKQVKDMDLEQAHEHFKQIALAADSS